MSGIWEPRRAELDADPPRDPALPAMSYIICSTPRSGSGMLCRGLADSGLGGLPAEYYNVNQRGPLAERWGTGTSATAYTAALRARRSSAAGVFGTKLHWDQFDALRAELGAGTVNGAARYAEAAAAMAALLPGLRWVHLVRLEVDRQAVSLWIALHRNVWAVRRGTEAAATPRAPVPYDYDGIERCRQYLAHGELSWDRFFRTAGIAPVPVTYDAVVAATAPTVQRVLVALLGPEVAAGAAPIPAPDSVRQADAASEALVARYREDLESRGVPLPDVSPAAAPAPDPAPAR